MNFIPRKFGFAPHVQLHYLHTHDRELKAHRAYAAAKAGQADAALELVLDTAVRWIYGLRPVLAANVIFVAPHAQEAAGDNAIPQALAGVCAAVLGGQVESEIVQSDRVYHTGADPMERMATRAQFVGPVMAGASYVLVDDVMNMGGTLAELSNYIQMGGAQVAAVLVLVHAGRDKSLPAQPKFVRILQERYGHEFFETFGIWPSALSANEAQYLVGFRTLDEIRNRLATAQQEIHRRLRSKGIAHAFESAQLSAHAASAVSPGANRPPEPQ